MGVEQDGWNEYSRLVLAELVRLNENDEKHRQTLTNHNEKIQSTLSDINIKLTKIEAFESELTSIKKWRSYMEDIATPSVLKKIKDDVAALNTFKTVATTVWAIVQIGFGVIIALYK